MICPVCKIEVAYTDLKKHFIYIHNLQFVEGDCNFDFRCSFVDCYVICSSFKIFQRHLKNIHFKTLQFSLPTENTTTPLSLPIKTDCYENIKETIQNF